MNLGCTPTSNTSPPRSLQGEPVYYYAVYHLQNGGYGFAVMSREEVEEHRDRYSPSWQKSKISPWRTSFDEMALKTVLKRALKYAPKAAEVAVAMAADESVKTEISEDMSLIDSKTLDAEYTAVPDAEVDEQPSEEQEKAPEQTTLV